jgi:hypothetical protein
MGSLTKTVKDWEKAGAGDGPALRKVICRATFVIRPSTGG